MSTIRGLLRLRALPDDARQALADGTISASVAELIACRPSSEMRERVARYALTAYEEWEEGKKVKELPAFRDVKDYVRSHCMIELKQAQFSTAENGLAGTDACTICPKRTGNNKTDYPDARADICTDPACFREKTDAWTKRAEAQAKEAGSKVLSAKEAKQCFPYAHNEQLSYKCGYIDLEDTCYEDKKRRTYQESSPRRSGRPTSSWPPISRANCTACSRRRTPSGS